MTLNAKQQRFVDEYLVDLNATNAAKRAGYSERSAHVSGHRLLKNPKVAGAIRKAQTKVEQRTEVTQEWVLNKLVEAAERHSQDDKPMNSAGLRALELIGNHLGMFRNRTELTGKDGGPIETKDQTDVSDDLLSRLDRLATRSGATAHRGESDGNGTAPPAHRMAVLGSSGAAAT